MPPATALACWAELLSPAIFLASSGMSFLLFSNFFSRFCFDIFPEFPDVWQPDWGHISIMQPAGPGLYLENLDASEIRAGRFEDIL